MRHSDHDLLGRYDSLFGANHVEVLDVSAKVIERATELPLSAVLDNLAAGLSEAELTASYPSLVGDDVRAALQYAAELAHEQLIPLRGTGT